MPRAEPHDPELATPLTEAGESVSYGGCQSVSYREGLSQSGEVHVRQSRGCRLAAVALIGMGVIAVVGVGFHASGHRSSTTEGASSTPSKDTGSLTGCTSTDAPANAVEDLHCSGRAGAECDLKCKDHYQIRGATTLICGEDGVFRGTGTCEPIDVCAVNNGGCFEETGDPARKCAVTPWDGVTDHSCIECRDGFTRGLAYQSGDFCEPRCTAPVPPPPSAVILTGGSTAVDIAAQPNTGQSSNSSSKDERIGCAFPFFVEPGQLGNTEHTRHFVDCASHEDELDLPLPDGLPPGSSWCLTDPHDPTTVKQCIDCKGPSGLKCSALPEPTHGKFICSEDAPAYGSSCELQCDPGYASNARGAKATVECGWDEAWHNPSPFGVSESMGPETAGDGDVPTCTKIDDASDAVVL